jgi:hypothetical protein
MEVWFSVSVSVSSLCGKKERFSHEIKKLAQSFVRVLSKSGDFLRVQKFDRKIERSRKKLIPKKKRIKNQQAFKTIRTI